MDGNDKGVCGLSQNLREIIDRQKDALLELEREAAALAKSDIVRENVSLKEERGVLKAKLAAASEEVLRLTERNKALQNALYEQVYNEKWQMVSRVYRKSDVYFQSGVKEELNALTRLENDLRLRFDNMRRQFAQNRVDAGHTIYAKLEGFSREAEQAVMEARVQIAQEAGALSGESRAQFERLKEEQITEETIAAVGKKNNWEAFVGGNLLNKLGVLFVVLGIIAVSRFTLEYLPDEMKGVIMFLISGAFLAAGEWMSRKRASVFSVGLTSIGVAGLYAALSISYFVLHVVGMMPTVVLCVLITTGAFVLSQRYQAQTIAAFALVGGYIPIVSAGEGAAMVYGCMLYFVALNVLAVLFSFRCKWKITMFLGFFLNLAGTVMLVFGYAPPTEVSARLHTVIVFLHIGFAFAVYTAIPMISNGRLKRAFARADVVLLGINTFLSAVIMYAALVRFELLRHDGVMAMAFAVVYLLLGRVAEKRFEGERNAQALFYLTGLTFVVLVVPLQLGMAWLTLGWLVQGVLLVVYGIVRDVKAMRRAGFVITGLCLAAFVYVDVLFHTDALFVYKYLAVTLGSVLVLGAFIYKKKQNESLVQVYKLAALANVWLYALYITGEFMAPLRRDGTAGTIEARFLTAAAQIAVTFLFAMGIRQLAALRDKGVKLLSVGLSVLGMIWFCVITQFQPIMTGGGVVLNAATASGIAATVVLVLLCAAAVLAMRGVLMHCVLDAGMPVEWFPFGLSAYFLLMLTQNLVVQYGLSVTSIVISLVYMAAAFAWIVYGFVRRFVFMRRFGLGLSVLAVAKLFLLDLPGLTQGYKMLSYFAFGIVLLGISFVYQRFSKALVSKWAEDIGEGIEDDEDEGHEEGDC